MKLISWNVNGIKACARKGLLEFIKKERADFYCFQEVKSSPEEINAFMSKEGYEVFWSPAKKKGYSGVLTYSKSKPISVIKGIGDQDIDDEGRVVTLEFDDFFFINAYFPHAHRELKRLDFKLRFNEKFADFSRRLEHKKPVIIGGDFNVAHQEIDLRNPKQNMRNAGFTLSERTWFDVFLKQGYVDTLREFVSEGGHYTWWPYRNNARQRNIGWRIDYFLVSQDLKSSLQGSRILKDQTGSDHCPIILTINLP